MSRDHCTICDDLGGLCCMTPQEYYEKFPEELSSRIKSLREELKILNIIAYFVKKK